MPILQMVTYPVEEKWKPGANTLAYYKFDGNLNDSSGNGYNLTWSNGTAQYETLSTGKKVAKFSGGMNKLTSSFNSTPSTVSVWIYKSTTLDDPYQGDWKQIMGQSSADNDTSGWKFRTVYTDGAMSLLIDCGSGGYIWQKNYSINDAWKNIIITNNGAKTDLYVNGSLLGQMNGNISKGTTFWISVGPYATQSANYAFFGYMGDIILESVAWDSTKILDYYNQTKANYGL